MKFSIVSDSTGKAISEDRLIDEIDGYDEGALAELNTVIDKSLKALENTSNTPERIGTYLQAITESMIEIFNYINIIGSVGDDMYYLGFGDKVVPCGVEITIDNESCLISHPYQLYDDTIPDYVSSLELENKVHAFTLNLLAITCPTLLSMAALMCLNNSVIVLSDVVINHIYDILTCGHQSTFNYSFDTPYTLDPSV